MRLAGLLLAWMGLMGVLAVAAATAIFRRFPDVFSRSGAAVGWPWNRSAAAPARLRGAALAVVALASACALAAGIIALAISAG
jgi:hypothetical protein